MTKLFTLTALAAAVFSSAAMASTVNPTIDQIVARQIAEANALCKSADGLTTITTMTGRDGFMASCDSSERGRFDVDVSYDQASQIYKLNAKFDDRWAQPFGMSIDLLRSYKAANPDLQLSSTSTTATVTAKFPA